jgi:hypothetical protein
VPLQFLLARAQAPYATGIYPADSYPEEKTHNHAKYTYAPCLVVLRLAKIVKCGGNGGNPGSTRGSRAGFGGSPKRTSNFRLISLAS